MHENRSTRWISPAVAIRFRKFRPLQEPIRLQDLLNSARSLAEKKWSYCVQFTKQSTSQGRIFDVACKYYLCSILTLKVFRPTCNSLERIIFIQILLLIGKFNTSTSFYFSFAKVEAKPSSKYFGLESPI